MRNFRSVLTYLSAPLIGGRFGSLSLGIVTAMCAGLLLPALIGGMALTNLGQEQMNKEMAAHLDDKVRLLANSLVDPVWNVDTKSAGTIVEAALIDPQVVRITVKDPLGTLFLDIERPERRVGLPRSAQRDLVRDGTLLGSIQLETDDGLKQREYQRDRRTYSLVLLVQFVLALGLILLAIRQRVLRPLARLAAFSNQIGNGNLDRPLDWQRPDEIGRLAQQLDQMRNSLRTSFAEQQAILGNVQVGVIFVRERVIQLANRYAEHIFGHAPGAMRGLSSRVLYLSDEQFLTIGEDAYVAIATPEGRYEAECRLQHSSGTVFWARMCGSALAPESPQAGSIWVFEDITERRLAADQLRLSATVFENTADGVVITNSRQRIVAVNRGFQQITGYSESEVMGLRPSLLKSNRHADEFYAEMWRTLNETHNWSGEIWNRRKSGEVYPEHLTITAVFDTTGELDHYVGVFNDITLRKAAEDEIKYLAFYDLLTRLPNRRLMQDRLRQALTSSIRRHRHGALMLIDLDNFKTLNDTLGHDVGDHLLVAVAERLEACMRQGDTVARLGGDEFVVILENLDEDGMAAVQAEGVARKILTQLSEPFPLDVTQSGAKLNLHSHQCTSSIGITLFRDQPITVDELMKRADTAMYQAKAAGRNTLRFFDPDMQAAVTARAAMEVDLRRAIKGEQFLLNYQAQVDSGGRVTGVEVLLRWQHPSRKLMSPAEFIPLTEETGLILPIGQWVLETACERLAEWGKRPEMAHLTIAVNVSARQFHDDSFVDQVLSALDRSGANPQRLKLELTESLLVVDVEEVIAKMTVLKARGVGFSLDDFGTGYSSLSYLKRLPLDQLKIDQSFVRDILADPNDAAIAKMIVDLGESLELTVIAEGVETQEQRDFLATKGCLAYQGFYFSRPLSLASFEEFMKVIPAQR